jgi:ubiquinone/menaquinone biosynthesis C-methylase UbiE
MTKQELLQHLEVLSRKTDEEWLLTLNERKSKEIEFHNLDRDRNFTGNLPKDTYNKLKGNRKFYKTVQLSSNYYENWLKSHCKDRIFLDYACGDGVNAIRAAKVGASLAIGLDISDISIKNARALAEKEGLSGNTFFIQGDCENTGLPSECIDVGICSGMLHHLDLSYAFYELRRILKKSGGVILCIEALNYNPLIKLYRNITPQMRTEWEKANILSYQDIYFARRFFEVKNIRHWHLFSIIGTYLPFALSFLNAIDKIVLKLPCIKLMSWMFTFELHKKGS